MGIESVAIVGAGAMGAMYAAHFADAGFATSLIARGERAARLRDPGLLVNGAPLATRVVDLDTEVPDPVGLIVVAVKSGQLDEAIADLAPLVGEHTTILSVLNGLDSEAALADAYGAERVLLSVALAMDAEREGRDVTYRQSGMLVFGEARNEPPSQRVVAVQEALDHAELRWQTPVDMRHQMWWKFMVNVGINQASAVLRAPYGAFAVDGPAREFMSALIGEVIEVARAEGVHLGPDDLARWDHVLAGQPAGGRTSMHQDVEAGRPTEVGIFAGRVVELGRSHGIATPFNQAVAWILAG